MIIVIPEEELKEVIVDYLKNQMPDRANETFEVELFAGRGENGHRAEIEISKRAPEATPEPEASQDDDEVEVSPFNFENEEE
jgi:hypothetical protein